MDYTQIVWDYPKKVFKTRFKGAIQNYPTSTGTVAVLFTSDYACVIGEVGDTYTQTEITSRGGVLSYSFSEIKDFSNCYIVAEVLRDELTTKTLDVYSDSENIKKYGFDENSVVDIIERLKSVAQYGECEVTSNFS